LLRTGDQDVIGGQNFKKEKRMLGLRGWRHCGKRIYILRCGRFKSMVFELGLKHRGRGENGKKEN